MGEIFQQVRAAGIQVLKVENFMRRQFYFSLALFQGCIGTLLGVRPTIIPVPQCPAQSSKSAQALRLGRQIMVLLRKNFSAPCLGIHLCVWISHGKIVPRLEVEDLVERRELEENPSWLIS